MEVPESFTHIRVQMQRQKNNTENYTEKSAENPGF